MGLHRSSREAGCEGGGESSEQRHLRSPVQGGEDLLEMKQEKLLPLGPKHPPALFRPHRTLPSQQKTQLSP